MNLAQTDSFASAFGRQSDAEWWRGAVIYQIYPRSFQDSNADGVGDLSGIIHRLPYIARLGVDAIWISPFFTSPMRDFGYDVSNYRDVDPMFGSMGDFDALVERAHHLGIKVLIDLVLSHTSEDHPWFKESRSSIDNAKADYYVWGDPKPDGTPPNNWLSIFGGSAWEWCPVRMQYFMHNFLTQQPDLNFHNPEVRRQLLDIARFWLDRGVDGFRLDTVNFYFHDARLRDNPALAPEDRNDKIAPSVNPYNFQDHLYDKTQPENIAFLRALRKVCDEFPAITLVGEIGESQRGVEVQTAYTAGNDLLHMAYDFDLLSNRRPTAHSIAALMERFETVAVDSWPCWSYSNHDVVRHPSRWHMGEDAGRLYAGILMCLRGSVCLYQGEELGLTETYVAFEDLQDPYGKQFWPRFKGRDGCRTPMPWVRQSRTGGFTDGRPWLPVAVEHLERAVDFQEDRPDSTLAFYRALIAFRHRHPALIKGGLRVMQADADMLVLVRDLDGDRVLCVFNMTNSAQPVHLPPGDWTIDDTAPFAITGAVGDYRVPPYRAFFATGESQSGPSTTDAPIEQQE